MKSALPLIVGITSASGSIYGVRLLEILKKLEIETHLVMTKAAALTLQQELEMTPSEIQKLASVSYAPMDISAVIASGSFLSQGMIIAPCSIRTMSSIAYGMTDSLISRAADVVLKERRKLILMVRETPLHLGHLRTMTALSEMGAIIAPPLPAWYLRPQSLQEMVDHTVSRIFDLLGIELGDVLRWNGLKKPADFA